jgi:hypothetical protein
MNHHLDEMAQGIDDDMPLPAFDFLAGIVADFLADFGRLHTLAIDDPGAGFGCPALPLAFFVAQGFVDLLLVACQGPFDG